MKKESQYKYGIHPAIKLAILIVFTTFSFLPLFYDYRWGFLLFEIALAVIIRLKFQQLKGFIKFLLINFIGFYFLFYFIEFSWIQAFLHLLDYFLTISIISLQAFIFYATTPPFELIIGLKTLKVPGYIAFSISIAISFLPITLNKIREVLVIQKSRGYKLRLTNLKPIIIPTILGIMDYSTNLAISLEARGFKI